MIDVRVIVMIVGQHRAVGALLTIKYFTQLCEIQIIEIAVHRGPPFLDSPTSVLGLGSPEGVEAGRSGSSKPLARMSGSYLPDLADKQEILLPQDGLAFDKETELPEFLRADSRCQASGR